jgi:putative lipoprotein
MLKVFLPFMAFAVLEILSTAIPVPAEAADNLSGSEWGMTGKDKPFVQFGAEGKLAGDAGCNRFFGSYETAADGSIAIGPLGSTRMACPEPEMAQEMQFLEMLQGAKRFERDGTRLSLMDGSGAVLAELVQRDAD